MDLHKFTVDKLSDTSCQVFIDDKEISASSYRIEHCAGKWAHVSVEFLAEVTVKENLAYGSNMESR